VTICTIDTAKSKPKDDETHIDRRSNESNPQVSRDHRDNHNTSNYDAPVAERAPSSPPANLNGNLLIYPEVVEYFSKDDSPSCASTDSSYSTGSWTDISSLSEKPLSMRALFAESVRMLKTNLALV